MKIFLKHVCLPVGSGVAAYLILAQFGLGLGAMFVMLVVNNITNRTLKQDIRDHHGEEAAD